MTTNSSKIEHAGGRAVAVHGDDIDTDRIIPARFLKAITFDGLGDHVFEDDRREAQRQGKTHPFDAPQHKGARVLIANANFGCGSSREHAPQALKRWGIHGVIAESFAEIFYGNSMMIGLPCVVASRADVQRLMAMADAHPDTEFQMDLVSGRVTTGDVVVQVTMPPSARAALVSGNWDATNLLLDQYAEVERVAARLPYVTGWDSPRG